MNIPKKDSILAVTIMAVIVLILAGTIFDVFRNLFGFITNAVS